MESASDAEIMLCRVGLPVSLVGRMILSLSSFHKTPLGQKSDLLDSSQDLPASSLISSAACRDFCSSAQRLPVHRAQRGILSRLRKWGKQKKCKLLSTVFGTRHAARCPICNAQRVTPALFLHTHWGTLMLSAYRDSLLSAPEGH